MIQAAPSVTEFRTSGVKDHGERLVDTLETRQCRWKNHVIFHTNKHLATHGQTLHSTVMFTVQTAVCHSPFRDQQSRCLPPVNHICFCLHSFVVRKMCSKFVSRKSTFCPRTGRWMQKRKPLQSESLSKVQRNRSVLKWCQPNRYCVRAPFLPRALFDVFRLHVFPS